jgi:hypothetical protein
MEDWSPSDEELPSTDDRAPVGTLLPALLAAVFVIHFQIFALLGGLRASCIVSISQEPPRGNIAEWLQF